MINSTSRLPVKVKYLTDKRLSSFDFSEDDIMKVIEKLDPNKADGQNIISSSMIKICGKSICKPLRKIFEECLRTGTFPLDWKKGNIAPVFKKEITKFIKIIDPFCFCQFFEKF